MSVSEIGTLLINALSQTEPKTTLDIAATVRHGLGGKRISDSEIFELLLKAESQGITRRMRTTAFDESRPVGTVSWLLLDVAHKLTLDESSSAYLDQAMIVVSQPIFLSLKGIDLKSLGMPVLSVKEAMEKIVMDAQHELRIACPYYDELFIDVLSSHAQSVSGLRLISVLAEVNDPILIKAQRLFRNLHVKTLYRSVTETSNLKIQGIHAKLMVADKSEMLIGSFNFKFSHIYYNVDLGLLGRGRIAEHYARIFDSIWGVG
jgi:hypothetical protein